MRVLIVDDDPSTSKLLLKYLRQLGDCEPVNNGHDALSLFRKSFRESYSFDLICLDINMPGMDGHQTLIEIRNIEHEEGLHIGEGTKILMISALDDDDSIMESFMKLCDGYLTKPIKKKELLRKLEEIELLSPA